MSGWTAFLERISGNYTSEPGLAAVRGAFAAKYPELEERNIRLRAREADRDVVAVIYAERGNWPVPCGTPPYKLFAVGADGSVVEVPRKLRGPYEITGVK